MAAKPVFALDFDGVACDSVGESAQSAWAAAAGLWPDLFADPAVVAKKTAVMEAMRAARPVIETGYENLVQVRCLVEGEAVDAMLDDWPAMLADRMARWGLERADVSFDREVERGLVLLGGLGWSILFQSFIQP
jgi:hypothetical protein